MLLGLIRPTSRVTRGSSDATRSSKARRRSRASPGFVEGPAVLSVPLGPQEPAAARRLRRRRRAARGSRRCSRSSSCATARRIASAATRTACASGSASRPRCLRDPQLLLLDEPTTGLDPAGMRDMRDLVRRLAGEGITILLSSHLLNEVEELCNRVAIIRKGRIVYEGGLGELLATASDRLPAAHDRARTCARCAAGAAGDRRLGARRTASSASPQTRRPSARAAITLGQARIGITALVPADGEPRGALPRAHRRRVVGPRPRGGRMTAVAKVYRWEIAKLLAQKRTYLGLGAAMAVPLIFVIVLHLQSRRPERRSARPLHPRHGPRDAVRRALLHVDLGFPLITALVAGDIVASESQNGTLKTILTRSRERGEIFAGKVLASATYTVVLVFAMGLVGAIAGQHRLGVPPADVTVGHEGLRRARRRRCSPRASACTCCPCRDRRLRGAALDGDAEQRRLRGRRADVGAAHAAARRAARERSRSGPTSSARSSRRGTDSCAFPPTGRL